MPIKTRFLVTVVIFIPLMVLLFGNMMAQDKYLWKNRVIILAADDTTDVIFQKQLQILRSDPEGLKERDLVIITMRQALESDILGSKYKEMSLAKSGFRFYLRGKDGGVKYEDSQAVTLEKLYAIIDAMPMRRREMREGDH